MSEDHDGRELAPRGPEEPPPASAVTPIIDAEGRSVERFSAGPRAHTVGLTEERGAQIVRQSGNARMAIFLALLFISLFIPVYWFYETGIPAIGAEGRMAQEARRQVGGDSVDLTPISRPGTAEDPRPIRLELTASLEILDDEGTPLEAIAMTPGETIRFELDNTAGFAHNLYIGPAGDLATDATSGLPGVPAWSSGTRTFDWMVPLSGRLQFACTIPGHYTPMHGDVVILG